MSDAPPPPPPSNPAAPPPPPPPTGGAAPPPAGGAPPPPASSGERTLMLILAYLGLLALIPLLMKKDDREVQWHAKNGLALMVVFMVFWVGAIIVQIVGPDFLGCIISLAGCVIWIGYLIITILAIVKAVKGERLVIPGISNFAGN